MQSCNLATANLVQPCRQTVIWTSYRLISITCIIIFELMAIDHYKQWSEIIIILRLMANKLYYIKYTCILVLSTCIRRGRGGRTWKWLGGASYTSLIYMSSSILYTSHISMICLLQFSHKSAIIAILQGIKENLSKKHYVISYL